MLDTRRWASTASIARTTETPSRTIAAVLQKSVCLELGTSPLEALERAPMSASGASRLAS